MKIRVTDYIAEFLVSKNIIDIFTVVGGGSMYLNDSFGHDSRLHCLYNHHEQASAMAAESYYRINNKMAALCVTSGPGGINALNGVAGAYLDSVPMIVFSGQTKTTLTIKNSGLNLRTFGNQEFDIVSSLSKCVKYAETVMHPDKIRFCLEKAYFIALSGRPGPVWLDIPVDVQGTFVDSSKLEGYNCNEENIVQNHLRTDIIKKIIKKIEVSERPVIYAGNGIRIAGASNLVSKLAHKLMMPVVTCWNSIDLIETDDEMYAGRGGIMGDRTGNFAVQNSDLLLCIGTRLSIYQVGYNVETWARKAFVIDVDIDPEELKKPTIRVDLPINADAGMFMEMILDSDYKVNNTHKAWIEQCNIWKEKYPVVNSNHYKCENAVNVYAFIDCLSRSLPNDSVTVVANGSASVVGSQTFYISRGQRFIMNCAMSSMGYDLPAAIGACIAKNNSPIICIAGDGSIQMNLQELQTIVTNKLPIKIFVINNNGYHQIRQTQNNIFNNGLVGVGPDSGDLGFPDFEKLSWAYGIPYERINNTGELRTVIKKVLERDSYILCEVMCTTTQMFEPKSSVKKLEDGTLFSPPLEDMAPFLSRKELAENMYIDLLEEK